MLRRTKRMHLGAVALTLGLLTGCGGAPAPAAAAPNVSDQQVCDSFVQADLTMNTVPVGRNPDQTKFFANALLLPYTQARRAAPTELASSLDQVIASVTGAAQSGDRAATDPALNQQLARQIAVGQAWVHQNCGFQNIDVRGFDYLFQGIPMTIPRGYASFAFSNQGASGDDQRLTIYRERAGVNLTIQQLRTMSEAQLGEVGDAVVETWAPRGQSSGATAILIPGNYAVVDFNGTPPHSQRGMVTTFTVV